MKGSAFWTSLVGLADGSWSLPTWLDCVGSTRTAEESVTLYKVLSFALPEALDGLPGGSGAPFGQHLQHHLVGSFEFETPTKKAQICVIHLIWHPSF